jgi:hypothetical protein
MVRPGAGSEGSAKNSSFAPAGPSALINKSPHVCRGVVNSGCCVVSAVFKLSPAPLLPPKLSHRLHELSG